MEVLYGIGWVVLTLAGMELFSWFLHKYLFHGVLWRVHRTHHQPHAGWWELNDVFSAGFGLAAILLIFTGIENNSASFWVGIGISLYGMLYFVLHDLVVHQRIRRRWNIRNRYLKALIRAHRAHHRTPNRDGAESFGLLFFHRKFFS